MRDRKALSSFQFAQAIMNFPFDEITQLITLKYFFWNVCSSIDKTKTAGLIAIALKRACHVPFSRWIEESEFFAFFYITQSSYFHLCCIKETIGIASMINILKEIRMQRNMRFVSCLNS